MRYFFVFFITFFIHCLTANQYVNKISFNGNYLFSDQELRQLITTRENQYFSKNSVQTDIELLKNIYSEKEYFWAVIYPPEMKNISDGLLDISFRIQEGSNRSFRINKVSGNHYFSDFKIFELTGFEQNHIFTKSELTQFSNSLLDLYLSRNFLFAEISYTNVTILDRNKTDGEDKIILIDLEVSEGLHCNFSNFLFRGNEVTRASSIMKISRLNLVENISYADLRNSQELVLRKDYINRFSVIPVNENTILFDIEEGRMTRIFGVLSYNNRKNDQGLSGFFKLEFLNLFGTDRSANFLWQSLEAERSLLSLEYHESGPEKYPIAGNFGFSREIVDSLYVKNNIDIEVFRYSLSSKLGFSLGVEDVFPDKNQNKYSKKSYKKAGIFFRYNNEDFPKNPRKGSDLLMKYFTKFYHQNNKRTNKFGLNLSYSLTNLIKNELVLYNRIVINYIEKKDLQQHELIPLGGFNNLRGFHQNQFYGYLNLCLNNEIRYLFAPKSRFYLFADYGYTENLDGDEVIVLNDLLGYGIGLSVTTRVGLLGLSYGLNYTQGEFSDFNQGIVNFGIEIRF